MSLQPTANQPPLFMGPYGLNDPLDRGEYTNNIAKGISTEAQRRRVQGPYGQDVPLLNMPVFAPMTHEQTNMSPLGTIALNAFNGATSGFIKSTWDGLTKDAEGNYSPAKMAGSLAVGVLFGAAMLTPAAPLVGAVAGLIGLAKSVPALCKSVSNVVSNYQIGNYALAETQAYNMGEHLTETVVSATAVSGATKALRAANGASTADLGIIRHPINTLKALGEEAFKKDTYLKTVADLKTQFTSSYRPAAPAPAAAPPTGWARFMFWRRPAATGIGGVVKDTVKLAAKNWFKPRANIYGGRALVLLGKMKSEDSTNPYNPVNFPSGLVGGIDTPVRQGNRPFGQIMSEQAGQVPYYGPETNIFGGSALGAISPSIAQFNPLSSSGVMMPQVPGMPPDIIQL